jgi:transposase-like protein
MWHQLAHRVGRSSQATPAAVDKSHKRLEHENSDIPAQAGRPGVSVAALAMRHEINANQLRRWMRLEHLAQPARPPAVLPVTLAAQDREFDPCAAPPRPAPICPPIEIEVAGAIVRVHHGTDAVQLRMVGGVNQRGAAGAARMIGFTCLPSRWTEMWSASTAFDRGTFADTAKLFLVDERTRVIA